jgi:DNA-binding HxlR family transcriptional regulator
MRRKSLDGLNCPVARSLDVIGDWWSLLIVRDALSGVRRFKDFERSLGLAKNILSTRLKALVIRGILDVVPASDGSAYHEYLLTEKGRKLLPVIIAMGQWGSAFLFEPNELMSRAVDSRDGKPLAQIQVRASDGRVLGPDDLVSAVS